MSDKNLTENKKILIVKEAAEKVVNGKMIITLTQEHYAGLRMRAAENLEDEQDLLLLERLWEVKNVELTLHFSLLDENYQSGTAKNELVELARIIASKTA